VGSSMRDNGSADIMEWNEMESNVIIIFIYNNYVRLFLVL
jgi:hypothetical protein